MRELLALQQRSLYNEEINPLNAKLNPICHFLALLGAHYILHVSRVRVNNLYCSPIIFLVIKLRRMRWAGHVVRMGEKRGLYRVLVGKLERKWPLGRPSRILENNIKKDIQEVGCGGLDWNELA
jgi:hypothetical protein